MRTTTKINVSDTTDGKLLEQMIYLILLIFFLFIIEEEIKLCIKILKID